MIFPSPRRLPTIPECKKELNRLYRKINKPDFIPRDPVQFPHRYKNKPDREIAAFLAAAIAWGRRDLILKSAERMFALMEEGPYLFVMEGAYRKLLCGETRGNSVHRTFFERDLLYYCRGLKACYTEFGSLEALFASADCIWDGIDLFRETMTGGNGGLFSKHVANPGANSACKRINLALRWLVRREGPVDLGLWDKISPSSLYIPLDLHVGQTARRLGLLDANRKANDKKAVIVLTEKLREFCPADPVKYDLALFGYSLAAPPLK